MIECDGYFTDANNALAFESAPGEFEHITFDLSQTPVAGESLTLVSETKSIPSLFPLMEIASTSISPSLLWGGLGALVGGAAGIASAGGGGGGGHDDNSNNNGGGGGNATGYIIAINPPENGGLINDALSHQALTLSGTSDLPAGTSIIVNVNGTDYTCVAQADGAWCVTLSAADVSALADGMCTVNVRAYNAEATVIAQTGTALVVDTDLPVITFNPIGDNILNAAEVQQNQILSGTVANAHPGDILVLTLNGHTYQTAIQADMTWQVTLPAADLSALMDGTQSFSATLTNSCGNAGSANGNIVVDTQAPFISINNVTADNVLNNSEHSQSQIISGTTSGSEPGDIITITLAGKNWTTVVDSQGNWQVGIPSEDVRALTEGTVTFSATITDHAGNARTTTHNVLVDVTGPNLTIDPVATDDTIDALEKQQPLMITGTCDAGVTAVTLLIGGNLYTATVNGTTWSVALSAAQIASLPSGDLNLVVSATDSCANKTTLPHQVQVDSASAPAISIEAVTGDNILNAAEVSASQVISGKVINASVGDAITVKLGSITYTTTVIADTNGELIWKVTIPATDLAALAEGTCSLSVEVISSSNATAQNTRTILIDKTAPVITIDKVAGDDIINSAEHGVAQIISGGATGVTAGAIVTVTLNGKSYTTTTDASGKWSVGVPAADVTTLSEGKTTIQAEVSDTAGNKSSVTRDITTDLTGPALAIDKVTSDDIVNAAEKGADLTLSGTCGTDVSTVKVTLNGKTYDAIVSNGTWSLTVSATDVAKLADGTVTVTALAIDTTGNTTIATHDFSVVADSTHLPTVTINAIGDDCLNAAEVTADQTINGKVTNVAVGDMVKVTLNGKNYTATVGTDLTWSITVPTVDLALIADGKATISAEVTAANGNKGTATHDITVDVTKPVVTINAVATDDIINKAEHDAAQIISGTATGVNAGTTVTIKLNGKTYTTTTDASGNWSVGVPKADVTALTEGKSTITAEVSDAAGNKGSATHDVTVNTAVPTVTINDVTTDNVLNKTEHDAAQTVSGTTTGVATGTTVTIKLNGQTYTATTDASGNWSVSVPVADIQALAEGNATITAEVSNTAGNSASATHDFTLDLTAPTVTVNDVTADNTLNTAEKGADITLSGTCAADTKTVTVTLNGKDYTATVTDGTWSVTVPKADAATLTDGTQTISVKATDNAGNSTTATHDFTVDTGKPAVTINDLTADNILNAVEHNVAQVITGTATAGAAVVVTLNGKTYTTTADASGNWSVGVPAADIQALSGTDAITIKADVTGSTGNTNSATHDFTLDLLGPAVGINKVAGDDIVNAAEKGADLTLTGTCGTDTASVKVTFNGKEYTATVTGGTWSVTVPKADMATLPEGSLTVTAVATDAAGNPATANHSFSVETSAAYTPTITIHALGDDWLNADEVAADQNITGSVTFANAGDSVKVTLNGQTYSATVGEDLTWKVTVPTADLILIAEGKATISAEVTAANGNKGSATHDVTVDKTAPVVTINAIAVDDVINKTEHDATQIISGTATGVPAGTIVSIRLNGKTYTAVTDADGDWSVGVPAVDIHVLDEGLTTIKAEAIDAAGNKGSVTRDVTVDLTPVVLTVDKVTADDIVNVTEKNGALTLSGTCGQNGLVVSVKLNGKTYTATVAAGKWTLSVPAADVALLPEGNNIVTAVVTDTQGNVASVDHTFKVDTQLPTIIFNTFCGDNILNATEVATDETLSGSVTGAKAGDIVTIHVGVHDYTATVTTDLTWSVKISSADLKELGDGLHTITADVTNKQGNSASAGHDINIDAGLPGLFVNPVTGDDIVNFIEHENSIFITGSCTGLALGTTISIKINGQSYTSTVQEGNLWSLQVPVADVALWDGTETIKLSAIDDANQTISGTHDFRVDLTLPAITINPVTADNVINNAEHASTLTISGETIGVEANQLVTLYFAGKSYIAAVGSDGKWSVTVSANDMTTLQNGLINLSAKVNNEAGDSAATNRAALVALDTPPLHITTVAGGDNIINIAEHSQDMTISGTAGVPAGCKIEVTLNGETYTTQVNATGNWSVTVPKADVMALETKDYTITAKATDQYGNTGSVSSTVSSDALAPTTVFDNPLVGDNVINSVEHNAGQLISGTSINAEEGDIVTLKIGAKTYSGEVDADGAWSFGVPASVIKTLPEGENTLTVTITDKAGNSSTATKVINVITALPTVTIDKVAGDDIINALEISKPLALSGTSDAADGATVIISLGSKTYTATVTAGIWNLTVSTVDLSLLSSGDYTVSAKVVDVYNNSQSTTRAITVDIRVPSITFDTFAGDNTVNATEATSTQTLSGHATNVKAGDKITIHFGSKTYQAIVKDDLSWSVNISAADVQSLGDGQTIIQAEVTTASGNHAKASLDITVDAGLPTLSIDTVSGDNVINAIEHNAPVIIAGTSKNVQPGAVVTVTINGVSHDAVVKANGTWQVGFTSDEVSDWPAGTLDVEASTSNSAGNSTIVVAPIDVNLSGPAISMDAIAVDNIINGREKDAALTLTGTTIGVEENCTVMVKFGGKNYTAKVDAEGNWSVTISASDMAVLPDGQITVEAFTVNKAGNRADSSRDVLIDTRPASLTVDTIAGDNIINAAEHAGAITISGTSDAGTGKTVHLTINGNSYSAEIDANGKWSATIPADDVVKFKDGFLPVIVSVNDDAGNLTTKTALVAVDASAPTLTFANKLVGDDVINTAEHGQAQVINGSSTGLETGSIVTVKLTGASGVIKTYVTTVDEDGNWSIGVTADIIQGLADGIYTFTADAKDASGNLATQATHDVQVKTALPEVAITSTSAGSDDVLNKTEKSSAFVISGTSNLPDDSALNIAFNGKMYHALVTDGAWTFTIPHTDIASMGDGLYTITVQAIDIDGNTSIARKTIAIDTVAPTIVINAVATDDIINADEASDGEVISGKVVNGVAGDKITVKLGDKTYTATVKDDLTWSVTVSADDLTALPNGRISVIATATDSSGNISENYTRDIGIAIKSPVITIDDVAGDSIINELEHDQVVLVTGSATNLSSGDKITLVVKDGDVTVHRH